MSLKELFVDELKDLYSAEQQLTKALPKLAKNATSPQLKKLIEAHLEETEGHVKRLEEAFEMLDEKPKGKHCAGIAGIVEEGSDLMKEDVDGAVLDAGIIAGAQRAEHYEIAAYGSVMAWAKVLGLRDIAQLLSETLEEEKGADEKLTALAEKSINRQATGSSAREGDEVSGRGAMIGAMASRNRKMPNGARAR
jgi:ferritin-like metal-binding protein YciE